LVPGYAWPGYKEAGNLIQRAKCEPGKTYTLRCTMGVTGELCFGFYMQDGSAVRPYGYTYFAAGKTAVISLVAPEYAEYAVASRVSGQRRPMLVEGTTPAAWAPADGESLPGGGAQMSANLWTTDTNLKQNADGTYTMGAKGSSAELQAKTSGMATLAENQIVHMGASLRGRADSGSCQPYVEYADAAGNKNWVGFPIWTPTAEWQRFEGSCVVPSGMTITALGFNNSRTTGTVEIANPVFSYGESGPILASDSHTPYATQDHVKAVYATNADLKICEDAITSEVSERTKLSGRVGTLESTSSDHTTKITQLSSSIESMVKGEATYTAPDGTTKTNGLYSKIEQTADGINKTFGQYTKTADLAATQAVKDAKKAGTDAAIAASAAQSTANTAKSTADNLATLIHEGEDGITVGKSADGKTFTQGRTHMSAEDFDVLDANGDLLARFGKTVTLGSVTKNSGATVPILSIASEEETLEGEKIESTTLTSGDSISLWATAGTQDAGQHTGYVEANRFGANLGAISEDSDTTVAESVTTDARNGISLYTTKGVSIDSPGLGGTKIKKRFAGTSVVNSLGSDFDLFSGDACKSRFGELIMPDDNASWVLLASPGQGSYDHHITLSPTSSGGVHGYITPSVTGNVRVQWMFIKF
jgi:hypothetical protein